MSTAFMELIARQVRFCRPDAGCSPQFLKSRKPFGWSELLLLNHEVDREADLRIRGQCKQVRSASAHRFRTLPSRSETWLSPQYSPSQF